MSLSRRLLPVLSCWLAAALLLGAMPARAADGIAVIVAPDSPLATVDRASLAAIFKRRQRVTGDGTAIVPVNLPADDRLRIEFSRAALGQDPGELDAYWNERYFHGIAPPHVVNSVEAMLRFVASTPGAIGYAPSCRADARVRVLLVLPSRAAGCGVD